MQMAIARALFGEAEISGRLPVTIPGVAERGSGISKAALSPVILRREAPSRVILRREAPKDLAPQTRSLAEPVPSEREGLGMTEKASAR
jgi:hypothetical protein